MRFIEDKNIQIYRQGGESGNQRACYSGHKRFHYLIYQAMRTPDGLIFHFLAQNLGDDMTLPFIGTAACTMYNINRFLFLTNSIDIHSDKTFLLRPWVQAPCSSTFEIPTEHIVDIVMSAVRVSMEHSYKYMKKMWSSQDFKRM